MKSGLIYVWQKVMNMPNIYYQETFVISKGVTFLLKFDLSSLNFKTNQVMALITQHSISGYNNEWH